MKNKTRKIICFILAAVFVVGLVSVAASPRQVYVDNSRGAIQTSSEQLPYVDGAELYTSVASEEEAERIAGLYGIELVSYSYEVATYHTTENPYDIVSTGKTMGLPELSVNVMATADTDQVYYKAQ